MKLKFGAIVVDGSGKIGGHVVSKNRGGKYLRTKVTPNNPNTVAQQNARALLSNLSTAWAGLTNAQRLTWNNAVADFATTDIFGDIKNPSGFNLFVKLNANVSLIGETFLTSAPAKMEVPYSEIASAVLDLSSTTLTVNFADNNYDTYNLIVSATPSVSQGKTNVNSLFRVISDFSVTAATFEAYDAYVAKFGVPSEGANISLGVEVVVPSGQKGVRQTIKVLVQA